MRIRITWLRMLAPLLGGVAVACSNGDTDGENGASHAASIVVRNGDGLVVGADVVFHDADGLPTTRVVTDAAGRASAEVSPGSMVTILMMDGDERVRATLMGVQPGDEIAYRSPVGRRSEEVGVARVQLQPLAGAVAYEIDTACSSIFTNDVSEPIDLEVRSTCLSADGKLHLLALAKDADGKPMAQCSRRDLAWEDPMEIAMDTWEDMTRLSVALTNAPMESRSAVLALRYDSRGLVINGPSDVAALEPGHDAAFSTLYAPGFADRVEVHLGVLFGAEGSNSNSSWLVERAAAPRSSRTIDLAATLLPRISAGRPDLADPARPSASFASAGDLSGADGAMLQFEWYDGGLGGTWACFVPPGTTGAVELPALPDALAAWAPPPSASWSMRVNVAVIDADWIGSYGELRRAGGIGLDGAVPSVPQRDVRYRITAARSD